MIKEKRGIYVAKTTAARADIIAHATKRKITENIDKDPAFYEQFSKLIQDAIDDFKQQRISDLAYLQKASDIRDRVMNIQRDDLPERIREDAEACAYFGAVKPCFTGMDINESQVDAIAAQIALVIKHAITYAGKSIPFHLIYSKRKSMEIVVYPDGSVSVKAPLGADEDLIEHRLHKRARWITRQIRYFAQFDPRTPKRRFVGGESHLYLGRKYRLKITRSEIEGVLLKHGFFHINVADNKPEHVAKLLEHWYRRRADVYFSQVLGECWLRFQNKGVDKPTLKIRIMKTRWGSLSRKGAMTSLRCIQDMTCPPLPILPPRPT